MTADGCICVNAGVLFTLMSVFREFSFMLFLFSFIFFSAVKMEDGVK